MPYQVFDLDKFRKDIHAAAADKNAIIANDQNDGHEGGLWLRCKIAMRTNKDNNNEYMRESPVEVSAELML